jgi:hypothetical protein
MAYFLLLALVLAVSFIFLLPKSSESPKSQALTSLTAGFVFLAIGFAAQLILGFHLDNSSALLFYWARETLALAWFGHALLLFLFGSKPQLRWLTYALVLASLFSLVLVGTTRVTKAEDWFQPARPIYAQIGDLLATNRPTRWGSELLNAYGAASLLGGATCLLLLQIRRKWKGSSLTPIFLAAGAAALLLPIVWPPQESNVWFFLVELAGPVAIYFGFANLIATYLKTTKKPKRERTR